MKNHYSTFFIKAYENKKINLSCTACIGIQVKTHAHVCVHMGTGNTFNNNEPRSQRSK